MNDNVQLGQISYRPHGMPADAVIPEARPGRKAGNYLLDVLYDEEKTAAFLVKQRADDIETCVTVLIKTKLDDVAVIEDLFTNLFICLEAGYGKSSFLQLVEYYRTIRPKVALEYHQRAITQKYFK